MASETTTTSANDVYFAAWIADRILDEARPYNVTRPFFRREGAHPSSAVDFPIQDDPGAASATYTEGTGLSNTQLTTSKNTATAISTGAQASVTDELMENWSQAFAHCGRVLGRSTLERFETDATALLDDFSNTTGTAGSATKYRDLIAAGNAIAQRDLTGQLVGVIDPAQAGNVMDDVGTSAAALFGNDQVDVMGMQANRLSGYAFTVGTVPFYQTSLVTSSGGAVFLADHALGLYEIRPVRTETIRVPGLPGTQIDVTTRYGMVEIRDAAGQTLVGS